ncbi:hypothetical protein ACGFNU_36860 [Spirillospora sp. NPDC048911]|uniref:hypothetical protein n=1 Tax=Spirillospora sp. NPDC048911 TaxID=3364527 RepID=UPI00371AE655
MRDEVLSIFPADPYWQPEQDAADGAAALATALAVPDGMDVTWYETLTVIPRGEKLVQIECPLCGASVDTEWWSGRLDAHFSGRTTVDVRVPCCGGRTTLDALRYDWPSGFARFEITLWNPKRTWFDEEELAALSNALGHPVRQVRAHI